MGVMEDIRKDICDELIDIVDGAPVFCHKSYAPGEKFEEFRVTGPNISSGVQWAPICGSSYNGISPFMCDIFATANNDKNLYGSNCVTLMRCGFEFMCRQSVKIKRLWFRSESVKKLWINIYKAIHRGANADDLTDTIDSMYDQGEIKVIDNLKFEYDFNQSYRDLFTQGNIDGLIRNKIEIDFSPHSVQLIKLKELIDISLTISPRQEKKQRTVARIHDDALVALQDKLNDLHRKNKEMEAKIRMLINNAKHTETVLDNLVNSGKEKQEERAVLQDELTDLHRKNKKMEAKIRTLINNAKHTETVLDNLVNSGKEKQEERAEHPHETPLLHFDQ